MGTIELFRYIAFFLAASSDVRVPNHGIHTGYIVGDRVVSLANLTWVKRSSPDLLYPRLTGYQTGRYKPRNGETDITSMVLREDSHPWPGPAARVWKIGDSSFWTYLGLTQLTPVSQC